MGSDGEQPSTTVTRTSSLPAGQEESYARRTEILVLAIGVLFLVSQLILIVWLVLLPIAIARGQAAQRAIAWTVIPGGARRDDDDDRRISNCHGLRRNIT